MSASPAFVDPPSTQSTPPQKKRPRFSAKFLVVSILAHVLFFAIAAYWVVQIITPKPKQEFVPTKVSLEPPVPPVEKAKLKDRIAGGTQPPKIAVVNEPAKIVVTAPPDIPAPTSNLTLSAGPGDLPGPGNSKGKGVGQPGKTIRVAPIGTMDIIPGALVGTFYDLKLTKGREPTGMTEGRYADEVRAFVNNGWHESRFSHYLKGQQALNATQIFFPEIDSSEGPKAFHSSAPDSPGMWIVVYRGQVSPPENGTYRFVGAGDDDMIVCFDGKVVLNNCEHIPPQFPMEGTYHYANLRNEFRRSLPVKVEAGKFYTIEILIGDHVPFKTMAALLVEQEGVTYQKEGDSPILPPFTVVANNDEALLTNPKLPPHMPNGPVWQGKVTPASPLDQLGH